MIVTISTLARPVDSIDFSDITSAKVVGPAVWVGPDQLDIPFDRELTPPERWAVVRRLRTSSPAEENAQLTFEDAATANAAYLADPRPLPATQEAQIKALTRQVDALMRLAADTATRS